MLRKHWRDAAWGCLGICLIVATIAVFAIRWLVGSSYGSMFYGSMYLRNATLSDVQAATGHVAWCVQRSTRGIRLPSSAHRITVALSAGRDQHAIVIFRAKSDQIETFVKDFCALDLARAEARPIRSVTKTFDPKNMEWPAGVRALLPQPETIRSGGFYTDNSGHYLQVDYDRNIVWVSR